ncbi:MAG: hypothetical protein IT454_04960 [Planctomycetes bacterium]|nr:hypothetical protein [Planctomycetota bacterium]
MKRRPDPLARRRAHGPRAVLASALLVLAPACKTYSEELEQFSNEWDVGRFEAANATLEELIADDSDVELELVARTKGTDESIDLETSNGCALLLEKGMVNLVLGDSEAAIKVWRRCRDTLDVRYKNGATEFFSTALGDDTGLQYAGADYEHILVRAMLALAELVANGPRGEAYPYALQIAEKQEEIIGSSFGEAEGYKPRAQYQRVALGAYLQGVILEEQLSVSEAHKVYARGLEYAGQSELLAEAVRRTQAGEARSSQGHALVHVFYLAGRGPKLVESQSPATDIARDIVAVRSMVHDQLPVALFQKPIPIPAVAVRDPLVAPLEIAVDGERAAATQVLLDLNVVATQQALANLPMILARAVVRRIAKGVGSHALGQAAGESDKQAGQAVEALANLFSTVFERADTRQWSTLPAFIHVARFEVPTGEHALTFGAVLPPVRIAVDQARDTYIVIVQPNTNGPGAVLVDAYSRVDALPASN